MRSSTRAADGVDRRRDGRLHASVQHDHAALAAAPRAHSPSGRQRGMCRASRAGSNGFSMRPIASIVAKSAAARNHVVQQPPLRMRSPSARHLLLDEAPPDVDEPPVLHARRTCRLACAAREAAIEVQLRALRDRRALEHLLHEVDAPARTVELVAQQVVRRACGEAEAAVHALAQDRVGLEAARRILDPVGELGLHGQKSYMRPGLRMPAGSNASLRRLWILASAGRSGWKMPSAPLPPRKMVACPPSRSTVERSSQRVDRARGPAKASAPFDQLGLRRLDLRRGLRQRQAPQRLPPRRNGNRCSRRSSQ